jgi:hypothetical protein
MIMIIVDERYRDIVRKKAEKILYRWTNKIRREWGRFEGGEERF